MVSLNRNMLFVALWITAFMGISDGLYSRVASDLACYDAKSFETEYYFNAPAAGSLVGIELEWVSGGVTCDYSRYPYENWGCDGWGTDRLFMNLLQHQNDGSKDRIYPTSSTDGLTELGSWSCSNGCTARYSVFSGVYDAASPSLVWVDEANPITVTTSDTFSLQYSEGCCGSSTGDNDGTACAKVHFLYPEPLGPTSEPTTAEPTAVPTGSPTQVAPYSFDVAAGYYHSCALHEHALKCWVRSDSLSLFLFLSLSVSADSA